MALSPSSSPVTLQRGFVFQTFNLLGALTAQENVEMPMVLLGELSAAERAKRASELLATVGLSKRLDHFPSQLSGGEQQRVTIARAIANRPELLLLDEPTGDLDSVNGAIVMDLLTKLHERGLTLVMVTHDVHLKSFADRVIWMRDGKIARIDTNSDESKRKVGGGRAAAGAAPRGKVAKPVSRNIEVRLPHHYATDPSYDAAAKPADLSPEDIAAGATGAAPAPNNNSSSSSSSAEAKKSKTKKAQILDLDDDNESAEE
jgi:ABC-type nitrate/sulfonate/bicarbonate transport system ATPase subunit